VLREFGFCPGHIGKEQSANILQTLLDKLFDLLEPLRWTAAGLLEAEKKFDASKAIKKSYC
jgi:hypothetical protein